MKTRKVELTVGGKNLAEAKIQGRIFPGDVLSLLLFIIAMKSVKHILRIWTAELKLRKSQERIAHLMYMNEINLFTKNEKKKNGNFNTRMRIYSQ